jgi:hypothetical protein
MYLQHICLATTSRLPYEALDGYIGAMEEWVEAAWLGKSVADLIPVNVPANPANAEMLIDASSSSMKRYYRNFESDVLGLRRQARPKVRGRRAQSRCHRAVV